MGYWSDKCFMCYFTAALLAIIGLTTKEIIKTKKKKQNNEHILPKRRSDKGSRNAVQQTRSKDGTRVSSNAMYSTPLLRKPRCTI